MLSREIQKLWRSCWKSRAWTAHGIIQSRRLRKLRKRAKNCENMYLSQLKPDKTLKRNFAKTLRKACEKLRLSQYFAKFLNFRTTRRRGVITPTTGCAKTVENQQKTMVFAVLSRGGFAAKCTIFRKYISHFSLIFAIICNPTFRKTLRCTPWCAAKTLGWRWSFGRSASAAPREMTWRPNWMSRKACHNFSACERCTFSWTQNSSGNPHARIYTP